MQMALRASFRCTLTQARCLAATAATLPGFTRAHLSADAAEAATSSSSGDPPSKAGKPAEPPAASVIDEAVRKITLNLGLKTEALAAHGVGVSVALERQQQLHLKMLLAARRKGLRERHEGGGHEGLMISEALRRSVEASA